MRVGLRNIYHIVIDALVVMVVPVTVAGIINRSSIADLILEPLRNSGAAFTMCMAYYLPCFLITIGILLKLRNRPGRNWLLFALILGWFAYLHSIFWFFFMLFGGKMQIGPSI